LKENGQTMKPIRLIRAVSAQTGRGPGNGQYALQKALREFGPPWLRIGGILQKKEIPWFWCWEDGEAAALCARTGQPFVAGPNILFAQSRQPCHNEAERAICAAASCRLLFTESHWYRRLIEQYRGPANRAPLVVWPYPIDPHPGGPLPAEHDLLIYEKSGVAAETVARLQQAWPRSVVIHYGRYRRDDLIQAARRSRCCVYLSDDDRGPLALAEILLSGCPAVGIPRGAPFIRPGRTGVLLDRLDGQACVEAVAQCRLLDRKAVGALAARQFDARRIVGIIVAALGEV
jgi:hypothetical protein